MPGRSHSWFALLAALALAGCSRQIASVLAPNAAPSVHVSGARVESATPDTYAWRVTWTATDPDGRVSHYLVALDPASLDRVDATWARLDANERLLAFPTGEALKRASNGAAARPHVLAVRAVDDRGAVSEPRWFVVAEGNLPPTVQITHPVPSAVFTPIVPTSLTIQWEGNDPDGMYTTRPVRYRYKLFRSGFNPDFPSVPDFVAFARANPDSVRAIYAPFESWDLTSGDTTQTRYTNLAPQGTYLFIVVPFDEWGDYGPVFSASTNMLAFEVAETGSVGPRLTLFGQNFHYAYPNSGTSTDRSRVVKIEVAADQPVTFNWLAEPPLGAQIEAYRWVLDPKELADPTPRSGPNDLRHWSEWSLVTTAATVGPFPPSPDGDPDHWFYVEARDDFGRVSLGILNFGAIRPTFKGELLVVDDTRLAPDNWLTPTTLDPPHGEWPSAAELDTFLYAVGGVPWRAYPPGTTSPAGVLHGYAFDTLGTRGYGHGGVVPAGVLGGYRHVIWLTDPLGATYTGSPNDPVRPRTALRAMTSPGQANALALYVQSGGKLWLAGGGAAYASLIEWNRRSTPSNVYTAEDLELIPGRLMFDSARWRSRIEMLPASIVRRAAGADPAFPAILQRRNTAPADPIPPLRTAGSFYVSIFSGEYVAAPNEILEGGAAVLDTLAEMPVNGVYRPSMTVYHGSEGPPVVFSGFDLWYFKRAQCVALVDYVLQNVWGLSRSGPVTAARP